MAGPSAVSWIRCVPASYRAGGHAFMPGRGPTTGTSTMTEKERRNIYCTDCNGEVAVKLEDCPRYRLQKMRKAQEQRHASKEDS